MFCSLNSERGKEVIENLAIYLQQIMSTISSTPGVEFNIDKLMKDLYSNIVSATGNSEQATDIVRHIPQITLLLAADDINLLSSLMNKGLNMQELSSAAVSANNEQTGVKYIEDILGINENALNETNEVENGINQSQSIVNHNVKGSNGKNLYNTNKLNEEEVPLSSYSVDLSFIDFNLKTTLSGTFLFMDYETFNRDPKGGRASQFACIRTDKNLNVFLGKSLNLFCEQCEDNIPSITAALITGITPQKIQRYKSGIELPPKNEICENFEVLNEYNFIKRINEEMSVPSTCTIGYNNYAFDDEYTRNLLYRNLFDPYEREYKFNNSRFDVYLLLIATYVLRPNLLVFPKTLNSETGKLETSFKLEELSKANKLKHFNAHDAFSDVVATLMLMKLIKSRDEAYFNYIFQFRLKDNVTEWFSKWNLYSREKLNGFIHISSFYGRDSNMLAPLLYICEHPKFRNKYICIRLDDKYIDENLKVIFELTSEELSSRLYLPNDELKKRKLTKLPVSIIEINKCPILVKTSNVPADLIDNEKINRSIERINPIINELERKFTEVFSIKNEEPFMDTDKLIYSGFFDSREKNEFKRIRKNADDKNFDGISSKLTYPRIEELIFKFKARNFPDSLKEEEKQRWKDYAKNRIRNKELGAEIVLSEFWNELDRIKNEQLKNPKTTEQKFIIIDEIESYVRGLL